MDWGAAEQVFRNIPRNSVRQRVNVLQQDSGTDSYMRRLEQKWNEVWVSHRGTDILSDEDATSATNFDLIQHVEFLRQHIDKNAL
jgi:transcription factor C subunit 3